MARSVEPLPLPENPALATCASTLNDGGYWACVLDTSWRVVYVTDEITTISDDPSATVPRPPVGSHWFSTEWMAYYSALGGWHGVPLVDMWSEFFRLVGPFVLATTPGGREALRQYVDPFLSDLVDELQPVELPQMIGPGRGTLTVGGASAGLVGTWVRIYDDRGVPAGVALLTKPSVGMSHLAAAAAVADVGHLERMRLVQRPDRRPAAILMADLEASTPLAQRLSTAQYFSFVRRLVRVADQCIIDNGGIVGRHAGDGVVAFFLADTAGSESEAARACVSAVRSLREALPDLAARSDVSGTDVSLRFGLHWGATLYMGWILTGGRSEVTALGDEVNEAARIEACATGGKTLASKALIERLNRADADALGLHSAHMTYTRLADLPTATDKARRDAPSIPVCEIHDAHPGRT